MSALGETVWPCPYHPAYKVRLQWGPGRTITVHKNLSMLFPDVQVPHCKMEYALLTVSTSFSCQAVTRYSVNRANKLTSPEAEWGLIAQTYDIQDSRKRWVNYM